MKSTNQGKVVTIRISNNTYGDLLNDGKAEKIATRYQAS